MTVDKSNIEKWAGLPTPFYYYNLELLQQTVETAAREANKRGYVLHYATKANANPVLLKLIFAAGFGADCVSGNEILRSVQCGVNPQLITFAGVGKTDSEINTGLDLGIFSFNCESIPEMENIDALAKAKGKIADIAIRINPDVDAKTHKYISTGKKENKFGISAWDFEKVIDKLKILNNLRLVSLHFHVGSQITDISVFAELCSRANHFNQWFYERGFRLEHLNVGGGLGIDYQDPESNPVPDFAAYFSVFEKNIKLYPNQKLHFEPGRSIVAQCGSLITRVLYVKEGKDRNFVIVDAGMSDLIRPALYGAHHRIENITSDKSSMIYDIVGPICESSDCFDRDISLPETRRGDFIAIRSAGAYGEVMVSQYNLRSIPQSVYSK